MARIKVKRIVVRRGTASDQLDTRTPSGRPLPY